ncbi:MAG: Rieske 2Fe-2S domain-containing protein [Alphaproteobacteria bacterium]
MEREIFAIRKGREVFVYANVCPHRGLPLNWKPDIFLSYDKSRILCVLHACTFDIETGQALTGPCPGQSLEAIAVTVVGGAVRLAA